MKKFLKRKIFKILLISGLIVSILSTAGLLAGYAYIKGQIPKIDTIADYKPDAGTKVYSYDGELIAEFYDDNKRNIVPVNKIPKLLKQAFVAGEDSEFYTHSGVNFLAMAKAAVRWALTGVKQGGSTITQQLAKAFLPSKERTVKRKIRDIVLAIELEKHLKKEEILYLYLNEIYLGSGSYGVETASRTYFSKHVWELSIDEMAILAGLPKFPGQASPLVNPKKTLRRRNYVLKRMFEEKFISEKEYLEAKKKPIKVNPQKELFLDKAPYFSEKIRRYLQNDIVYTGVDFEAEYDVYTEEAERMKRKDRYLCRQKKNEKEKLRCFQRCYRNQMLYRRGLTVYTTVDMRATRFAHEAMFMGMRALTVRQGYSGPLYRINIKKELDAYLKKHREEFGKVSSENIMRGKFYQGVVTKSGDKRATVRVGDVVAPLYLEDIWWAKPYKPEGGYSPVNRVSDVLAPGDVIMVHATDNPGTRDPYDHRRFDKPLPKKFRFVLEQKPRSQGAIIVKDPYSGYVLALMGGNDFEQSELDRTTQSIRQPGSAIKPLFFAVALDKYDYTSASRVSNEIIPSTGHMAMNHDVWQVGGKTTFREALVHSMNLPSQHILKDIGIANGINGLKKLGIHSPIKRELGSVLGSSELTMDEITDAYAHFPNRGMKPHTTNIRTIYDKNGNLIEDNTVYYDPFLTCPEKISRLLHFCGRKEEHNLSEESAYIMTKILEDAVQHGTGAQAASIKRHIGGKTGTTNDYVDAWFIGFSPEIVTGVWVGNDLPSNSLGRGEYGGKAALPIWKDFMQRYLWNFPKSEFPKPENVVMMRVDKNNGSPSESGVPMFFTKGTEPKAEEEKEDIIDPNDVVKGLF